MAEGEFCQELLGSLLRITHFGAVGSSDNQEQLSAVSGQYPPENHWLWCCRELSLLAVASLILLDLLKVRSKLPHLYFTSPSMSLIINHFVIFVVMSVFLTAPD